MITKSRTGYILLIFGTLSSLKAETQIIGSGVHELEFYFKVLAVIGPGLILTGLAILLYTSAEKKVPDHQEAKFIDVDAQGDIYQNGKRTSDISWRRVVVGVPFFAVIGISFLSKAYIALSIAVMGVIWASASKDTSTSSYWYVSGLMLVSAIVPLFYMVYSKNMIQ